MSTVQRFETELRALLVAAGHASPPPGAGPVKEGEERRYTGVLHYTEIPPVKSVEAFMGR